MEAVELLKEWQLESEPGPGGRSLRRILLEFVRAERYWIGQSGRRPCRVPPAPGRLSGRQIAGGSVDGHARSQPARFRTARPGRPARGPDRAGRPGDEPLRDEPAYRVDVLARLRMELICRGQVMQRIEDEKARGLKKPDEMEPVEIVDYDPSWPKKFAELAESVRAAFSGSPLIAIEHVGVRRCGAGRQADPGHRRDRAVTGGHS